MSSSWASSHGQQAAISSGCGSRLPGGRHLQRVERCRRRRRGACPSPRACSRSRSWPDRPTNGRPCLSSSAPGRLADEHEVGVRGRRCRTRPGCGPRRARSGCTCWPRRRAPPASVGTRPQADSAPALGPLRTRRARTAGLDGGRGESRDGGRRGASTRRWPRPRARRRRTGCGPGRAPGPARRGRPGRQRQPSLSSRALVAITPIVVLPEERRPQAEIGHRRWPSPSRVDVAERVDGHQRADDELAVADRRGAEPAGRRVLAAPPLADRAPGARADRARSRPARRRPSTQARVPGVGVRAGPTRRPRRGRRGRGRRRSAPDRPAVGKPMPCSSHHRITPSAAASPNAEPPVSRTASTPVDRAGPGASSVELAGRRRAAAHLGRRRSCPRAAARPCTPCGRPRRSSGRPGRRRRR